VHDASFLRLLTGGSLGEGSKKEGGLPLLTGREGGKRDTIGNFPQGGGQGFFSERGEKTRFRGESLLLFRKGWEEAREKRSLGGSLPHVEEEGVLGRGEGSLTDFHLESDPEERGTPS